MIWVHLVSTNLDEASVWHLEAPLLFSKSTLLLISHDRNNQIPSTFPWLSSIALDLSPCLVIRREAPVMTQ